MGTSYFNNYLVFKIGAKYDFIFTLKVLIVFPLIVT